jgi:hypothetical protein
VSDNLCKESLFEKVMKMTKFATIAAVFLGGTSVALGQPKLPESFDELPKIVRDNVDETRAACREQYVGEENEPWKEPSHPTKGITAFYLGGSPAVLVDNHQVCGSDVAIKGANCHTWGCDLVIYRKVNGGWKKVLDEPVHDHVLNVNHDQQFVHVVMVFTHKYTEKCGNKWDGVCTYLMKWKDGKFSWQNLGGGKQ